MARSHRERQRINSGSCRPIIFRVARQGRDHEFHVEYQPQNAKGAKEGGVVEVKWNIPGNTES